jgi:DNA polymerase III subunit alpha
MAFVHLHVHSQYSLLDGAIPIGALAGAAKELGQSAVALTDHCNLYGAVAFDKSCKKEGVSPVFGSGVWIRDDDGQADLGPNGGYHLLLLVKNQVGYHNLCALLTEAIFEGMHYKPMITMALLARHSEGLIALTSGMRGPVRSLLAEDKFDQAEKTLNRLGTIFDQEDLFLELQDVGFPNDIKANAGCRRLSETTGFQTVVTNAVHYLTAYDVTTLELLQCIGQARSLSKNGETRPVSDQLYLKSEAEIRALFPEDGPAIDRTVEIAERCKFRFTYGTYYFPASTPPDPGQDSAANFSFFFYAFPPPMSFGLPQTPEEFSPRPEGAGTLDGYLRWYCVEGLKRRLERIPESEHAGYWARLDVELEIINSMGFPAYFLIVAEFINWAKDHDIPVGPGRGSAAGSIAAWALRITDIDPIRFDLLFERFLNPERISMPDIDVDFAQDRREEVIQHTREKYGSEFVSQIITYGKLQAKMAIRDVARVCDLNFMEADRIAKAVPDELGISLEKAAGEERMAALIETDPKVRRTVQLARSVEGLTRQTGVHAAGVVIADRPLVELAPLYRDGPEGGPVVQFEMKAAESLGLIKFDFLGLKTLDQIRDALALIERNTGEIIDLDDVPEDDEKTFDLLRAGDGLGVFQVESSGMRELLTKLQPSCLEDLVALVALFRPGPLNAGMVDDFIDRKHGRKSVEYMLPQLEPILNTTYGVVVYQEQVMRIAQELASYSLGEADLLRRAMGKKDMAEMDRQKTRFVDGAVKNEVAQKAAEDIFDLLAMFAAYGFNKSHSAAYGYISYQTAFLKANHRGEYMAALMSIEANNTDKVLLYIGDCRRAGLEVLPPDVNESTAAFDVPAENRRRIRFGLTAVKNVGAGAVEAIVEAREACGGRFKSFMECLENLDYKRVNKRVMENLVKCGAFDWTGIARSMLFAGLEGAIKEAQRKQADKASGQASLFGGLASASSGSKYHLPEQPEWPISKLLSFENDAVGFFLSGHPVEAFVDEVDRYTSHRIEELSGVKGDSEVAIAGMPSTIKVIRTRRGDKMAFVTLEDDTSMVEVIFFSEPYQNARAALESDQPILVKGKKDGKADGDKVLAESVELLSDLRARGTQEVHLRLNWEEVNAKTIAALEDLLQASPGSCATRVCLVDPGRKEVILKLGKRFCVAPDEDLTDGMAMIFRRNDVVSFL